MHRQLKYVLDGGMGKYLLSKGIPLHSNLWASNALLQKEYHSILINCHKDYFKAGCNVITTANYNIKPRTIKDANMDYDCVESLTKLSVELAHKSREQFLRDLSIGTTSLDLKIAGCIPPIYSYRYDLVFPATQSIDGFKRIIHSLNTVDIYLIETMSCIKETIYCLIALSHIGCNNKSQEIWVSFSLNDNGDLWSGETVNDAILALKPWFEKLNIKCVSFNCCNIESINQIFMQKKLSEKTFHIMQENDIMLGLYPNLLQMDNLSNWTLKDGGDLTVKHLSPKMYYEQCRKWLIQYGYEYNIGMIGGCCGVEPIHLEYTCRHLADECKGVLPDTSLHVLQFLHQKKTF